MVPRQGGRVLGRGNERHAEDAPTRRRCEVPKRSQRWWYWTLRLQIDHRRLTDLEEIAYERGQNAFGADASTLRLADRIFDAVLPVGERSTRLFVIATNTSTRCRTVSTIATCHHTRSVSASSWVCSL